MAAVDEAYKSWVNSTYLKTHKYRKGLAQVLGVLKSVDYVLLDDFTRLMRPLPASYLESHVVQKLKSADVKVWCVKGGITDLSNFADNLVASLISQISVSSGIIAMGRCPRWIGEFINNCIFYCKKIKIHLLFTLIKCRLKSCHKINGGNTQTIR